MSRTLELPDALYAALERAAAERGLDPVGWLAAALPPVAPEPRPEPPRTMYDLMKNHIGLFASGDGTLSQNTGEKFAAGMEEKRREGRL